MREIRRRLITLSSLRRGVHGTLRTRLLVPDESHHPCRGSAPSRAVCIRGRGRSHMFAHNPPWCTVRRISSTYVMVHIGCTLNPVPAECKIQQFACDGGNSNNGESGITVRVSNDLRTWSDLGQVLKADRNGTLWDTDTTNPSPFILPSGEMVLAYRECGYNCSLQELIGYATAPYRTKVRSHVKPLKALSSTTPMRIRSSGKTSVGTGTF